MADRMDELVQAVQRVEQAIKGQMFPIPPGSTPAYKNSSGDAAAVVLNSNGEVPVSSGSSGGTTTVVQANAGTNLNTSALALEAGGNLALLANTASNATVTALQASLIIKASAGRLYGLTGYNANTAAVFIQLHNTATVPADTQVPVVSFAVPAASNFSLDYGLRGRQFSGGIVLVTSTSQAVKVLGAANTFADAQFS